jgi:hypothetical protein
MNSSGGAALGRVLGGGERRREAGKACEALVDLAVRLAQLRELGVQRRGFVRVEKAGRVFRLLPLHLCAGLPASVGFEPPPP